MLHVEHIYKVFHVKHIFVEHDLEMLHMGTFPPKCTKIPTYAQILAIVSWGER